ncbi:MAG: hypothetical protein RJA70_3886 [Pseudomonadota bacterium]
MNSQVRGLVLVGLLGLSCQALSGVDDLRVVSDAEYAAADPNRPAKGNKPGGTSPDDDGTTEPEPLPDAGSEPEPEPLPDAGSEPEPEPLPDGGSEPPSELGACYQANCNDEYAVCAESRCGVAADCVFGCDTETCQAQCVQGLPVAEVDALTLLFQCFVDCEEQIAAGPKERCLVGVVQVCDCGAAADTPCTAEAFTEFEQCCANGPTDCPIAASFECLPDHDTSDVFLCNEAFLACGITPQ